jgi:hypothetical protein
MSTSTWTVTKCDVDGFININGRMIPCILENVWVTETDTHYKVQAHKHDKALDVDVFRLINIQSTRTYTRTESNKIVTND